MQALCSTFKSSGRVLALALVLWTLVACDQAAVAPQEAELAPLTPLAWPTLLPSPTPGAAQAAVVPTDQPLVAAAPQRVAPSEAAWSFVVTGDTWKDNPIWRRILSDAQTHGDDFIVVCGDITPQGRLEQFEQFANVIASVSVPIYVAPGNHDIAWSGNSSTFEQYFPRHQSFDHHNLHITIADDATESFSADELTWLENDLAATTQPLKMVFMHVPPFFPYPVPDEDTMKSGAPELMAALKQYNVSAVFSGHLHAYAHLDQVGVSYTITGGGGEPLHVPGFLGGRYHYVRVTVQGNTATQQVVWLDNVATPTP